MFLQYLKDFRQSKLEDLGSGEFTAPTADQTIQRTSEAIGQCCLLDDMINLEYDDIAAFYEWGESDEQSSEVPD